ncbi:4688_t:CDS:2 [Scutellospora calospora]|uniref:4688_t:CDS:1 n=1 Tax=Scutellospora calospora TaxID=85575 RepID=A0ACA9JTP8_9GLOM|nr:4688_t:CDS:2 [Scutellospora calospora]
MYEENNLSLLDNSEIQEFLENNLLENKSWSEEEISKFKILYYKTKDILENHDDDNQNLENEINLLQNNKFKESYDKRCCEKNCLQTQCDYSVALFRHINFKNLSKSFQDIYLLGIISATKRSDIVRNLKKTKLSTDIFLKENQFVLMLLKQFMDLEIKDGKI